MIYIAPTSGKNQGAWLYVSLWGSEASL